MKFVLRILLGLAALVVLVVACAYIDGATMPVDHSTTVAGTVNAAPDVVFAKIADIAHGPSWRPQVITVQVLDATPGHEHWVEDLGHGQKMQFTVVRNEPGTRRDVRLDDPGASYGGTWVYELAPGPTPGATTLKITENGYIKPPIYRFIMRHVIGMTYNLDIYLRNMQSAFPG
jgi:hypothetical protein